MEWSEITMYYIIVNVFVMLIFTIVVNIGGMLDLLYMFRELANKKTDEFDDGRVLDSNCQNAN